MIEKGFICKMKVNKLNNILLYWLAFSKLVIIKPCSSNKSAIIHVVRSVVNHIEEQHLHYKNNFLSILGVDVIICNMFKGIYNFLK